MSADNGPGWGGTALFVSPGGVPRAVAFAPAVRGYPGGIADMTAELDEYGADLSFGDDEPWEPTAAAEDLEDTAAADWGDPAAAEPGDPTAEREGAAVQRGGAAAAGPGETLSRAGPARAGRPGTGSPARGRQAPGRQLPGEPGARHSAQLASPSQVSVWQQSAAAWQEAGIDWMRPATAGPSHADGLETEDDPHTEPLPVLAADGSPRAPGTRERTGRLQAGRSPARGAGPGAAADVNGAEPETGAPTAAKAAAVAATAAGVATGSGQGDRTADHADAAGASAGQAGKTGPERDEEARPGQGKTAKARPGRRVAIVAVVALVLVAGALAGIGIARSGGGGPAEPEFTLVNPYPPAVAADTELAGPAAGVTPLLGALTGIAAAGRTVVAIGAEPSQPTAEPLILFSTDGGHTWARAALTGPGIGTSAGSATGTVVGPGEPAGAPGLTPGPGAAGAGIAAGPTAPGGPGTAPVLIARGGGTWLALGRYAAWASADGKTWHPAPALPPMAGDTVLGLAGTGTGFVAVGEHTGPQPGPVVWTSSAGQPWQRWTGSAHGLTARSGHVTALRWAAAEGSVVLAGGPITAAAGKGRRPDAGLWRSTNGGLTWKPVTLPAGHGATAGLAGLAANGAGFVAVRPGHAAGRQDAVIYRSAQGATWRYADKLTPVRRTSLQVTAVSGSSHGFAVAASVRGSGVAFSSAAGRDWHQAAAGAGTGVAGLAAGPGGTVLVAGNSQPGSGAAGIRPHLILISPAARQQVGQALLAASATPDTTVNGLAAGGRTQVAAGSAGGSPALWLASGGNWTPVSLLLPQAWRNGALVSVAHGGQGWLAIGQASAAPSAQAPVPAAPPAFQPVILTSATGTSWAPASALSPLAAPGNTLVQAAAAPAGYVVAGSARTGGTTTPAAWYSTNLSTWVRVLLPHGATTAGAGVSHQVLAVTAARTGFVAVGSAGNTPAAWISRNGSAWDFTALPLPAEAAGAVLTQVTAEGTRTVAAGYEWRAGSAPVPFTAASTDGGRTWRDAVLPAPPPPTVVTALTAAGRGFVAVGHSGLPGRQVMVAWWSADGLTWQDGLPAGGGPGGTLVTQINAVTAGNGTLTGSGFAAGTAAEHPILWHARYR